MVFAVKPVTVADSAVTVVIVLATVVTDPFGFATSQVRSPVPFTVEAVETQNLTEVIAVRFAFTFPFRTASVVVTPVAGSV
jgi:hypothetical protein